MGASSQETASSPRHNTRRKQANRSNGDGHAGVNGSANGGMSKSANGGANGGANGVAHGGPHGGNGVQQRVNGTAKPPAPAPMPAVSRQQRPWFGDNPQLEAQIPALLQRCQIPGSPEAMAAASEARALLTASAEVDAPITQFYLGVSIGVLEGEGAACDYYERALKQLPLLHIARNNLIRALMARGSTHDLKRALEHANLSAGLQPEVRSLHTHLHTRGSTSACPGPSVLLTPVCPRLSDCRDAVPARRRSHAAESVRGGQCGL